MKTTCLAITAVSEKNDIRTGRGGNAIDSGMASPAGDCFSCRSGRKTSLLTALMIGLALLCGAATAAASSSYAVWYGPTPPVDLLSQFDRIIVEADNLDEKELAALKQHGGKVLAYLSVGEWNPQRASQPAVDTAWMLGENDHWNSRIMDLTAAGWRQFLRNRATELKRKGFEGLFLDTLDSHMLPAMPPERRKAQQEGLVDIIAQIKADHPDSLLVANRGFEVMEGIAPHLTAVAAESLYQGWNNAEQQYRPVPADDRLWLTQTLKNIQARHHLEILILDYLPPQQREKARETARKIEAEGFVPWIANPSFDYMGIGALEAIPRRVLLLHDSQKEIYNFMDIELHRFCAPIFEYLGYIPVYMNINEELPRQILKGRYIGVVAWLKAPLPPAGFRQWLTDKMDESVPVALLGNLSLLEESSLLRRMGLELGRKLDTTRLRIDAHSELVGFESEEPGRIDQILPVIALKQRQNRSHLRMQDADGHPADLVVTGEWGGLAADPAILDEDFSFSASWIIDPFAFLKTALKLPQIPAPDMTTENGRRLLFVHIDGDGFMEKFETPNSGVAAQVLLREIFKVYKFPHTISIIEGEIGPEGLYPELSPQLEAIARQIFALDHVEIASHSYSHPFHWKAVSSEDRSGTNNLPIKGYRFNLEREIKGSVAYIDSRLAPPGKKTSVFFWTGNCLPTAKAIALTSQLELLNLNGGDTFIRNAPGSLTQTAGIGRAFDNGAYQTYAPITNENIYTNNWTGPYIGYRRVIETFQLTDEPRRLKPIDIYYHFYSGSKHASLKALKTVYDWAVSQETTPIYASDYIRKVLNYRTIGIAQKGDGTFRVTGLTDLKTLRLPSAGPRPQNGKMQGLTGWREINSGLYLHIGPETVAEFKLGTAANRILLLHQANGRTLKWQRTPNGTVDFRIQANAAVQMEVANAVGNCRVKWRKGVLMPSNRSRHMLTFNFPINDTGAAELECHE